MSVVDWWKTEQSIFIYLIDLDDVLAERFNVAKAFECADFISILNFGAQLCDVLEAFARFGDLKDKDKQRR